MVVALAIATLSGAAGVMHELLWTRRLVDLLGASAESTSRVLGSFMLGLALGAAYAARFVARCRRPAAGLTATCVTPNGRLVQLQDACSPRDFSRFE